MRVNVQAAAPAALSWVEQGLVPDSVVRAGIRRLCNARLAEIEAGDAEASCRRTEVFLETMDAGPIAPLPWLANEQHYEVPAEFFALALGPHRKYSCAYWPEYTGTLAAAEAEALAATVERAGLADGQSILELGCGWGSLTLWMAEHLPASRIVAVSNSQSQRDWITGECARRGFANVEVVTADMNDFAADGAFDRVVSVEMFEHMRNWRELFARVDRWLADDGCFFMHVFCHRSVPYAFVDNGPDDWMSRHFFSGGMMPSDALALHFQDRLLLRNQWRWSGRHYERTANAWLANLDARRGQALAVLASVHGEAEAAIWLQRWRVFFMACAELFGYRDGQEWWISHYLFERRSR
jgi:cyclopropane-fatty-acyl-phospholipid synthase